MVSEVGQVESLEHIEPEDVHEDKHGQQSCARVDEWLEVSPVSRVLELDKIVDHLWEAIQAEV